VKLGVLDAQVPNFIAEPEPYAALHRFTATRGLGFVKVESSLLFAHLTMRLLFFYSTMRADFCSSILRCGPP
jgi:hypothetical protein